MIKVELGKHSIVIEPVDRSVVPNDMVSEANEFGEINGILVDQKTFDAAMARSYGWAESITLILPNGQKVYTASY